MNKKTCSQIDQLYEWVGYIKGKVEGIDEHLIRLNGQTEKNTRFRYQAKIWMSIIGFIVVSLSTILNAYIIDKLTN